MNARTWNVPRLATGVLLLVVLGSSGALADDKLKFSDCSGELRTKIDEDRQGLPALLGKGARNEKDELAKHRAPYDYRLPQGYAPSDIVGMAIDGENNRCFAWHADGTVSAGTSENLAAHRKPEKVITGRWSR